MNLETTSILMNNHPYLWTSQYTRLEVNIDEKLTWDEHMHRDNI